MLQIAEKLFLKGKLNVWKNGIRSKKKRRGTLLTLFSYIFSNLCVTKEKTLIFAKATKIASYFARFLLLTNQEKIRF